MKDNISWHKFLLKIYFSLVFLSLFLLYILVTKGLELNETRVIHDFHVSDYLISSAIDFHGIDEELVYYKNKTLYFTRDGVTCKLFSNMFLEKIKNDYNYKEITTTIFRDKKK